MSETDLAKTGGVVRTIVATIADEIERINGELERLNTVVRVVDIAARDAIPAAERYEGLWVEVLSETKVYRLTGGLTNAHWDERVGLSAVGVPVAGPDQYGVVKIGDGVTVTDDGTISVPEVDIATATKAGIGELATLAEAKAGTAGCLLITAETLLAMLTDLDQIINIAQQVNTLGDFRLFGFRAADLPTGWHVCNGGGFAITSAQGKALAALPANFKTDWKITTSGSTIYKPNLLTGGAVRGQGPFFRPSTSTPGTLTQDAIRNITGASDLVFDGNAHFIATLNPSGAFKLPTATAKSSSSTPYRTLTLPHGIKFDASGSVPTAAENRPLSVAMTPAIWLGC